MWDYPSKKIILGDWVFHGNRKLSEPQTRWHFDNYRRFAMHFTWHNSFESWLWQTADVDNGFY